MKNIVFCGGGTAGHVMPNIALIEKLSLNRNLSIHYIGGSGIEKKILKNYPLVTYHEINTPKLIRKLTPKNLTIPFKLMKAISHCKTILKEINPCCIFSKGGYISIPVVLASKNIPILAHESDYSMGLANKIIYRHCNKMFFSFKDTALKYSKKGIFSGTPIRSCIFKGNKNTLKQKLKINNNKPNILIVGGSTGASSINKFIFENISQLTKKYNILHITGINKNEATKETIKDYYPIEYAEDIENYLALADIVISRAGSNAIFELLALKKLMLLIPLPKEESRGDQLLNAEYFYCNNFAEVLEQENLSFENLDNKLNHLINNKQNILNSINQYKGINGTNLILKEIEQYMK